MQHCDICGSDVKQRRISPQNHDHEHGDDERACGQCWEAYISLQVEEKKPDEIECMFCKHYLGYDEVKSFAMAATNYRYAQKLLVGFVCMARCSRLRQAYDREKDGRVFTCADCNFQVCTDCDRPEHVGESCTEYLARIVAVHGEAETKTREAFAACPDCTATILPDEANCHTQCECGYQFCSKCMVNWVGEGSAYLWGKEAHKAGCKYRVRDAESKHSLRNRWLQTNEVQDRIDANKEKNHIRNEAKKKAKLERGSDEDSESRPAKKAKREPKPKKTKPEPKPKKVKKERKLAGGAQCKSKGKTIVKAE